MDVDNIWERIQALPGLLYKISVKDPAAIEELRYLWYVTTQQELKVGCRDCRTKAYTEVTSFTKEKLIAMADQTHKLKDGVDLLFFDNTHYTPQTLTDDVARRMVEKTPAMKDYFETLPSEVESEELDQFTDEQLATAVKDDKGVYLTIEGKQKKLSKKDTQNYFPDLNTVADKA